MYLDNLSLRTDTDILTQGPCKKNSSLLGYLWIQEAVPYLNTEDRTPAATVRNILYLVPHTFRSLASFQEYTSKQQITVQPTKGQRLFSS
mmetsp:Transcript_4704/g.17089  ORF Transcript_4704/g.17089 Transcript_4704/m.17089 type:complete len:90 (-) Transcript_4704:216-485(-)